MGLVRPPPISAGPEAFRRWVRDRQLEQLFLVIACGLAGVAAGLWFFAALLR